jgi:hypothetical protein
LRITALSIKTSMSLKIPPPVRDMTNKGKQLAVPPICIDGEVVVGFNEAQLKKKLGLQFARGAYA